MKTIPEYTSRLFPVYEGMHILEFGNKRSKAGLYRDEYLANGAASYTSVDINGQDGAIPVDLRRDDAAHIIQEMSGRQHFDLITNIGTSEHVTEQRPFWQAVHLLSVPGTYHAHWVPQAEKRLDHAVAGSCWHPYPGFFQRLAADNGYDIELLELTPPELPKKLRSYIDLILVRYKVAKEQGFVWDPICDSLFWKNTDYKEEAWNYNDY